MFWLRTGAYGERLFCWPEGAYGERLYVFWLPGGAYVEGNAECKVEGNGGGNAEGNAKGSAKGNAEGMT